MPEQNPLKIEYLPIVALKPYPFNARTHSKKQIRQIAESIRKFGFINPVIVDRDNTTIAGHGRIEGAKQLGYKEVPTVRIEHLSDEQKRAYILADNRLAELAGWDNSILAIELQYLLTQTPSLDISVTGFDTPQIDLVIQGASHFQDEDEPVTIDETLPVISKSGDLWQLGDHLVLCGSALEESSFRLLLGEGKAQLVITDPPYNVPVNGHVCGLGKTKHREFAMASGEMSEAEFTGFLQTGFRLLAEYSDDGSLHFVFMDWRHMAEILVAGKAIYHELKNLCVWNKDNGGMGSLYRSKHELVFVFKRGKAAHINNVELGKHGRYRTNVWNYPGQTSMHARRGYELAMHPTVKPVSMIADVILDCSQRGGVVLDPFGGSGTALLAAERTGRKARLIEIDPGYVDVTIRRWQALTGKEALHTVSGKTFNGMEADHG
jgi:DNA modification methylase